ncbi:MAG: ABC transporter ATP-binding protein [Spirochaetota bacterium]
MSDSRPVVEIRDLHARLSGKDVLRGVSAAVPPGSITVVLGASGSGKTTLLKHILGLLPATRGTVHVFGEDLSQVTEPELASIRRRLGMLFQAGALLNSRTVGRNARIPLEQHTRLPDPIIDRIVRTKLRLVGLPESADRLPGDLSGGMRKRAALARALALDPELLLCDEPSSGLDPPTSEALDRLLINLRETLRMTMLVISHDIASVRRIADHVLFLYEGRIAFQGTMQEADASSEPSLREFLAASGLPE